MTRLTDADVYAAWNAEMIAIPATLEEWGEATQQRTLRFARRIAALAVQEVERERDGALNRLAQLHAQLAEVTKERDAAAQSARDSESAAHAYRRNAEEWKRQCGEARAQLATAKREAFIKGAAFVGRGGNHLTAGDVMREADARYPATPSGAAKWDISEPRNHATPSPEAREPVILLTEDHIGNGVWRHDDASRIRITPEVAKRIVAMGTE